MATKIVGLSRLNLDALGYAVFVEDAPLVPTATTAEWVGWTPSDAIAWLDRVMKTIPGGRSHPRGSLHAVRRRLLALASNPAAPAASISEEETMTKSTITRAEIEKRRRTAKKQAAETPGAVVERVGDEFRVVTPAEMPAIVAKVDPVVELPATDAPTADGQALAASLRERLSAEIDGVEIVATPTAVEHRVRLGGRTLAYVTPQKRSVRVHLTGADGKPVVKVSTAAEMDAAIHAIDELARTS